MFSTFSIDLIATAGQTTVVYSTISVIVVVIAMLVLSLVSLLLFWKRHSIFKKRCLVFKKSHPVAAVSPRYVERCTITNRDLVYSNTADQEEMNVKV